VPTTQSSTPGPIEVPVHIYLIAPSGQLVARDRLVPFPAPLEAVLTGLVAGPTSTETTAGIQSAVPVATRVLSASISAGVATVNFSATFGQLVGPSQILAVAQIVFTATDLAGVSGVAFELTGQPVEVPVANGVQVPVATRAQFASLAPPVTASST
jgi:spore germination protein GerM